jgi:Protein of unknown function (DUF2997)
MAKQVRIHIFPDGRVQAEVHGIKGKACRDYLRILEEILDGEAIFSSYTPEYYEEQTLNLDLTQEQTLHQNGKS